MNSRSILIGCIAFAAGALALGFAWQTRWGFAVLAVLLGVAWALPELLASSKRLGLLGAGWLAGVWFGSFVLLAVGWIFAGGGWQLGLIAISAGLAAWDLGAFRRRVFGDEAEQRTLLRAYHPAGRVGAPANGVSAHSRSNGEETAPEAEPAAPGQQAEQKQAEQQHAEHMAFERAHLRALGWVSLVGVAAAVLIILASRLIHLSLNLGLALGLILAVLVGLLILARLLGREA